VSRRRRERADPEEATVIEMLRSYLHLASGVTQVTRQKALDVARQLVATMPPVGTVPGGGANADELARRASALADELVSAGRENRAMLLELVRREVETVVVRLGLAGTEELEAALASSRARVLDLERELADTRRPAAKKSAAKKSTAKKSTANMSTVKKSPAKKSPAKKSPAKKSPAKKSTAKKSTAKKSTAKKSTAKSAASRSSSTRASNAGRRTTRSTGGRP
jgi:hypothetical protein